MSGPDVSRRELLAGDAALLTAAPSVPRGAGEWPLFGATNAATKYSPLAQIDASNVAGLEIVGEWTSPDAAILAAHPGLKSSEFQATPIMVDGRLFTSTAMSQVAAIDSVTDRTLWVYDPGNWKHGGGKFPFFDTLSMFVGENPDVDFIHDDRVIP